jgi:putative DNA primase/helicase
VAGALKKDTKPQSSEHACAQLFVDKFGESLRHDHHRGKWYHWDGSIWRLNENGLAFDLAREVCRWEGLTKSGQIGGTLNIARNLRCFAVTSELWDQDPWLLGTPGGTVDLRDGTTRRPDEGDYITRTTAIAPADRKVVPRAWLRFLDQAMKGDQDLIGYLQASCGYCLTGITREHAIFFNYGPGGNGKSVFGNTLQRVMGSYAAIMPMETLMLSTGSQHPTTLAALRGARMVLANETEEGRSWAEAKIKELSGGTTLKVRFMRQDEFEYTPLFKLWIAGNHKPIIRNVDDAIRRRFKLMPWLYRPAVANLELEEQLIAEWPAILRWMIDGCAMWQKSGLAEPLAVKTETAEYFSDQDSTAHWLEECCECQPLTVPVGGAIRCLSSKLYTSWASWCQRNGEQPGSGKSFAMALMRRGFDRKRSKFGVEFLRISTRQPAGTMD